MGSSIYKGTPPHEFGPQFLGPQFLPENSVLKKKFLREPSRLCSFKNRQSSGLRRALQLSTEEIRQIFKWFDTNRDGRISKHEYRGILEALGRGSSMEEVQKIFKAVDTDGDGYIDLNEFMEVHRSGVQTGEVESAFETFDVNGDRKISAEEVMRVLKGLGEKCSIEDCRRMVRAVDRNGDGMVDMDEFMTMMTRYYKSMASSSPIGTLFRGSHKDIDGLTLYIELLLGR